MSKILVIAGIILAAPLAVTLILQNWTATIGTSTPISLKLDWLIQYEPLYLFWSGVILAIVLLVLLLTIILWPRSQLLYLHQKSAGQVTVSKKLLKILPLQHSKKNYLLETRKYPLNWHLIRLLSKYQVIC